MKITCPRCNVLPLHDGKCRNCGYVAPTFSKAAESSEKDNLQVLPSGATRSKLTERFDLISPHGLMRLAQRYADGAKIHGDNNWRKGQPFSVVINHMFNHLISYLEGDTSDDNLAAIAWGAFALMELEETHPECNDLYFHQEETA